MFKHQYAKTPMLGYLAAAGLSVTAGAQVTSFFGYDYFASSQTGPRPLSLAAEAAWTAAASAMTNGSVRCIDMQQLPLNAIYTTTTAIGPGVTFTPSTISPFCKVLDGATESLAEGFDTSPSTPLAGDAGHRLSLVTRYVPTCANLVYDITFNPPVRAFGMWVTGEGNTVTGGTMSLAFTDSNASHFITMAGTIGAQFVGFTDPGQSITTVSLVLPSSACVVQPFISLDDICFVVSDGTGGCNPDYNRDGFVNGDDLDFFIADFVAGSPGSDYNGDEFVTGEDFDSFVVDFQAGC